MTVEQIRILSGPNYWSADQHNLIVALVDLQHMAEYTTCNGFHERLAWLMPFLEKPDNHGEDRRFIEQVKQGTNLAHVTAHIALYLQKLAGMNTSFSRHRSLGKPGLYHVVFSYEHGEAGRYAASAAVNITTALFNKETYNLSADVNALVSIKKDSSFGPSTGSIVHEALNRGIPCIRLDDDSLVQLGYGSRQKRIEATIANTTSAIAVELAGDKKATKKILEKAGVPVPAGGLAFSQQEMLDIIDNIGYPVVVKPRDGNQGKGATINVTNAEEAMTAFEIARCISPGLICEKFVEGSDFRALVINYKFVAAAMRKPACVVGDGKHTIQHLIEEVNDDPRRGDGHENMMTKIKVDEFTLSLLYKKGYTPGTILQAGEECFLKSTANLSTGGTATDVTDEVHPQNVALFNRIARVIGLDICGIDIVAKDLFIPIDDNGGAIIEVNAAPGFRMHLQPSVGKPRNVAAPVLDMLFPAGEKGTIPIITVSGTNGKTTTTRLIAHMCMQQGLTTGFTTTEGIYIQDDQLESGDCSGPASARIILKDPAVDVAVLECARGGILKGGLPFKESDTTVITNIAEDHLGLNGINTLQDLADVKSVVAKAVKKQGYAILNADDDLVYHMKNKLSCKVAFYSLHDLNPRVIEHCRQGGLAAVFADNYITILNKGKKIRIEEVGNIPLTFNGTARFNIANILGAVLAAYTNNININTIRRSLLSFMGTAEQNPGRMNMFKFRDFSLLADYAHNPHGLRALGQFINTVHATLKTGIIAGVGDRRDEDLITLGEEAGKLFDEVIIRMDDNLRGRTTEEICTLLSAGIRKADPFKKVTCIPDEEEAIRYAVSTARPGSFIIALIDRVADSIKAIKDLVSGDEARSRASLTPVTQFPIRRNVAV